MTRRGEMSFRKSWDKDYYEAKAKARLENEGNEVDGDASEKKGVIKSTKEEFMAAAVDAIGPEGSKVAQPHIIFI